MSDTLLCPERAVVDDAVREGVRIRVRDGVVLDCGAAVAPATGDRTVPIPGTLLPGLVDIQVNGAGGHNCDEPGFDALDAIASAVFEGGAQAFLPTLITGTLDDLCRRAGRLADWIERGVQPRAAEPLGIHLEGPFLEAPGTHDAALFVDPTPDRIDALLAACRGHLRLLTLAPSRPGAADAVRRLRAAGVAVSIGHARDPRGFEDCVDAGARGATHLFNVMSPLHHREPNVVGAALADERVSCSLILDGHHIAPTTVRVAWRALGRERFMLISDAISAAGMPDGDYELSGIPVRLRGGVVRNLDGALAGSALTMGAAARFLLDHVPGTDAADVARSGATNPARLIGAERYGRIAPGTTARFSVLAADGTIRALDLHGRTVAAART
ncbi:MAG: N-acetylglucosamine-6-phosphate deacetylase [Planctomycetes bacterium]|nr:N-acetylglucosamine-6-phosphate deacetylase [Planctomycetota bacterium]